ncbi:Intersectin 1 (SH3 domain protein) [Coemansia erecta]|uniref:Intersectin 1 (SH3 domain protein) n=1 Tax=Coemansia erecta TaxID=147472 RepID=A0A9W8CR41_9FUNG|nr:Intersectin 1 (SH3 domain protein) [Coemansia erecta]
MKARAIYACIAENPGEITFDAGDTLTQVSESSEDGWFTGTVLRTGDRGLFPVVYTELQPEPSDDITILRTLQSKNLLSSTLQLQNVAARAGPPPLPAKSAVVRSHTVSTASRPKPPVLAPKPTMVKRDLAAKPALPPKPLAVDPSDPEARHQREREAAMDWEAKHGIKKTQTSAGSISESSSSNGGNVVRPERPSALSKPVRPAVGVKPVFLTDKPRPPPASTQKPPLPARTPSTQSLHSSYGMTPSASTQALAQMYNPATENDAPALPYSVNRQMSSATAVAPIEEKIQPLPTNLISRMNKMGFEDNFTPSVPPSQTQQPLPSQQVGPPLVPVRSMPPPLPATSTTSTSSSASASNSTSPGLMSGGIPLTSSRQVQGAVPRPAAPPPRKQLSYVNRQPKLSQSNPGYTLPSNTSSTSLGGYSNNGSKPYGKTDMIPVDALTRYSHLFKRLDKESGKKGYLASDQVHSVIVRCRLDDALLRRIWALSDRNLNGKFGPGEFNIIMHLTDCALRKEPIPDTLPVDLLQSAYE